MQIKSAGTIGFLDYIESRYGRSHGNRRLFLKENQHITASELSRWITAGYRLDLTNGDIFKSSNKKVNVKDILVSNKSN